MARTNEDASAIDCVLRAVRAEGIGALWTGWWPATLRLLPVVLLVFPLMEHFRLILGIGAF